MWSNRIRVGGGGHSWIKSRKSLTHYSSVKCNFSIHLHVPPIFSQYSDELFNIPLSVYIISKEHGISFPTGNSPVKILLCIIWNPDFFPEMGTLVFHCEILCFILNCSKSILQWNLLCPKVWDFWEKELKKLHLSEDFRGWYWGWRTGERQTVLIKLQVYHEECS